MGCPPLTTAKKNSGLLLDTEHVLMTRTIVLCIMVRMYSCLPLLIIFLSLQLDFFWKLFLRVQCTWSRIFFSLQHELPGIFSHFWVFQISSVVNVDIALLPILYTSLSVKSDNETIAIRGCLSEVFKPNVTQVFDTLLEGQSDDTLCYAGGVTPDLADFTEHRNVAACVCNSTRCNAMVPSFAFGGRS